MDYLSGSFACFNSVKKDAEKGEKPEDKIKIWVLRCSRTGRVHYLEAYKDFVDILLGFLMLRTGALIRLNRTLSPVMRQAKTSAGIFGVYDSFKSLEDSLVIVDKDILLDPFQRVKVSEELDSLDSGDFECCNADCCRYMARSRQICRNCTVSTHFSCIMCGGYFRENAHTSLCYTPWRPWRNHMTAAPILTRYTVIQSCSPTTPSKPKKEGYVGKNIPFIITNELKITPLSTFNVSEVLNGCGAGKCEDLECYELTVGTSEVLVMLGAALISTTPLTDIFGKMCNKQTKVPSSASFCLLPSFRKKSERNAKSPDDDGKKSDRKSKSPDDDGKKSERKSKSPDHDGSSTARRKTSIVKQDKKNQKDLPAQDLKQLPLRLQDEEEQTTSSRPPEYVPRKQTKEQISKRTPFQQQPAVDMAPEPQPNCLGIRSSCRKKSPKQTPKRLSYQQQQASIEAQAPEDQPLSCLEVCSSSRRASGLGLSQAPTQSSSFQQQPASDNAPEPRVPIASEPAFIEFPENPPQQSILMERCSYDSVVSTSESSQSTNQTASPAHVQLVPSEQVQNTLLTRTPSPNALIRHSAQFSSTQINLPTLPIPPKSQSILNPLFRESCPSGASSRSSQPGFQPPTLPNSSIVHRSTAPNPSIVHRSYPQAEPQPRISVTRRAVRFGNTFAGTGIGSLPSVAAGFEQCASDHPTWSDVESTISDDSDSSTLDRLN